MVVELLYVILVSMLPGVELRGSIPLGIGVLGLSPLVVAVSSLAASTFPGLVIIYGFSWVESRIISRVGLLQRLYMAVLERIRARAARISRGGSVYAALALYVAVPLPLTGVWTGSLIAYILGLDRGRSAVAVFLGNIIACIIVTAASLGLISLASLL